MSKIQFINAVKNGAISGWHKHKILPSISIAQAILESGWGGSDLSKAPNYNLFGIKASDDWAGEVVNMPTQEWSQSKGYYWIRANFRKYNSWDESIEDHGSFFTNTPWRKQNYARVIGEKDYRVAAKMLRECGYATDVEYPNKLIRIIDQYNLTQYDRIAFEGGITNTSTPPTNTMNPDYYLRKTVGDSLSSGSEATAKHIDVTFIGDSLLVGTEPKLKRFKWKKANYNAKGSRQWTHTDVELNAIEQLKTMLANGQVHNYVVFILGTNRGVTADEIMQAVDLCGAGRKILLVDTLSEVAHREAVAQAYKQASEQYSNVFYGDWSRYSKLRIDDNYYKDGPNGERIHMTPIGYERHANFIMHALYQMYNYGNTSGTPKNMRSVADIEYDDGIFTSPIGETIIYNKKLNDQFSFKSKKGNVLWIEKVLQTDKEDPQEAIAEGVAYMKEHAHPAVHYTVKLNELPDTVSIGDTGIFIDHEFNPPLAIEARILNITTSETNKNANTVTIGNVKELFPQSKEDILALQQQLQTTREELLTQAYLDDVYEVKIESSNGLALAGGAEGFGKDLIEKVEGNTFYIRRPKSLSNGFKIKGKIDDKHLINRHDGLVADSLTNPIDFNPDYENPQGSDTAYPLKPFDSHELEVSEFVAAFYDESGGLISSYKVPIYLDGNFNLPVKFERLPHTMKITSDVDITFDYILVFEEYLSVEEDETTELTARVFKNGVEITDEIDHFNWTKVSSDGREDEGWKDLNKFNQTNKITIKASDLKDFESRFNVKVFDKRIEELIASNGVTIKNQISPAIAAAKAEAERMDAEIKKEIDTVLDRFDTERTETEQRINEALDSAKAEAERLDEERQQVIEGKFEVVNQAQSTLEQSIATAEQNAQDALAKAGASEDLASAAKHASDNALSQFQTTSTELAEAKATAEETLQNAINALSGANSVITQSQTLLDNAESAKTEAGRLLTTAQQQLAESGVISGDITTFKEEVNNAIKGYVTKSTYDSDNVTLNTRLTEWEKTADGITTSISEVEGKIDNLQIGGRNLISGTSNEWVYAKVDVGKWNRYIYNSDGEFYHEVLPETFYTVSMEWKKGLGDQGLFIFEYDENGNMTENIAEKLWWSSSQDGTRKSFTIKTKPTTRKVIVGIRNSNISYSNEYYYKSFQLEKGNIATDWSPAPEDNVSQSEYSVYKNETQETIDGFTRTVSAYKQDVAGYKNQVAVFNQTVEGYESEVARQTETIGGLTTEVANYRQAVDEYSSELSKNTTATNGYKTEVAGYKQTVDGYGSKLAEYTQSNNTLTAKVNDYEATVDGYTQSLSRVEGKVDNLEIGGRNLLEGTHSELKQYSKTSWDFNVHKLDSNKLEYYGIRVGTKLVYRVYINNPSEDVRAMIQIVKEPVAYVQYYGNIIQAGESGYSTVTFKVAQTDLYQLNVIQAAVRGSVSVQTVNLAKQKLEIGSVPTDWTPALEDLVSQSDYATYQNQVKSTTDEHSRRLNALDGDGGRVSKVEQTATQIQRNLSDYARTTYVDTKITEKAGEITTNLTKLIPTDTVSQTEFQTVKETTNLYERTIGTTGGEIKSKIAQIAMTDSLFQTTVRDSIEVGSTNLIPNSPIDWIPVTTQNIWDRWVAEELPVQGATTYTYSLEWQKGQYNQSLFVRQTLSDGTFSDVSGESLFGVHQNGRNSMTFTTDPLATKISLRIRVTDPSVANSYKYRRPKLEKGNIATDWSPAPEDKANQSQVTQLSNSWALTLKSGNDIKTAINATDDGIRLTGKHIQLDGTVYMTSSFVVPQAHIGYLSASKITSGTIDTARLNSADIVTKGLTSDVVKSEHILADNALFKKLFTNDLATQNLATKQAWIKSSMIGDAQIGTAQIGQIDASEGKIINLDVNYLTGNKAELISAGFQSLNSNLSINGGAIRIVNSDGDFATMNAIPEVRSQDSAGTAAILGKGRSQYYSDNQSRFYIGSSLNGDEYNGSVVHGVHISIGQTWGIYRKSDSFGGTPAQYHIVKPGESWRSITNKYLGTNASVGILMQLNGYNVNNYPVLQPGDTILIKKEVPGNSSGIERIWTMGTSSNGSTRVYSHVHHVFEGGTTGASDKRLKHDIKPTDIKALDHIADLSFKQFKWNRNDELEPLGLIAQESGILRVPDEEMEGIDIQRAMMLALKGIQELSQKVEKMEVQHETLRNNSRGVSD